MGLITLDNKLVIITLPKTIYFDLPNDLGNNVKLEIDFIIKHNEFLAEHAMKNEISQLLSKLKHVKDIHEHGKQ